MLDKVVEHQAPWHTLIGPVVHHSLHRDLAWDEVLPVRLKQPQDAMMGLAGWQPCHVTRSLGLEQILRTGCGKHSIVQSGVIV